MSDYRVSYAVYRASGGRLTGAKTIYNASSSSEAAEEVKTEQEQLYPGSTVEITNIEEK